jgi:hypothetical protein
MDDRKLGQTDDTLEESRKLQQALTKSVRVGSLILQMGHGFSLKKSKERHAIFHNLGYLYNIQGKVLRSKKLSLVHRFIHYFTGRIFTQ